MSGSISCISGNNVVSPLQLPRQTGVANELPTRVRRVRDSGALLLMIIFLGFLAYVIWEGLYVKGTDINLIVHGHDSFGNICGRNNQPIKYAEKSGQNYSNKPYTKYTLINAQFERYTLDSSRTKSGELIYVKEKQIIPQTTNVMQTSRANNRRQQQKPILETGFDLNENRKNLFSAQIKDTIKHETLVAEASISGATPIIQSNNGVLKNVYHFGAAGNDSDPYEHMLVTPISVLTTFNTRNQPATVPSTQINGLNQYEAFNQLLYLTECVTACPNGYVELIFYRCMPSNWRFSLFPNAINVTRTFIDDVLTDMSHCYRELIYTFSLALVLSLGLLILLRYLASFVIWSCLVLLISLFLSMASYSWLTLYYQIMDLNQMMPHDTIYAEKLANSDKWLIGSIFLTFIAFATIATVLFMRKRILMVTMLFRESGKAIADMPLLLLQPLLTFAALVGIVAAWGFGLICLQSMKSPVIDTSTGFVVFKTETFYKIMKWYHIFAFLWVSHFAIACQHYVIGASVSKWYFSPNRYELGSPIGTSLSELFIYYLGSVALGSFLVAVFKVIRIITRQIQFLVQRNCMSPPSNSSGQSLVSSSGANTNNTQSTSCGSLGYIWRVFIWFFDNIVMIINRDAYVEIAIHGHSFLGGARRAFMVLSANPLRLLAIKSVGNILLVIAKICVVIGTVSMAYVLVEGKNNELNYSWSPVIIAAIYAYVVAHWFLSVYEMVIDALFICYCEDYENAKSIEVSRRLNGSNFMNQILNNGQVY